MVYSTIVNIVNIVIIVNLVNIFIIVNIVLIANIDNIALWFNSNGDSEIKSFWTLPIIFSTSKYSRWKF